MPERIEIGEMETQSRRPIDASWSPKKKAIVGAVAGVLALGVLGGGAFMAWQNRPVSLPGNAGEAVAMINSGRIDRLDEQRRAQYLAEAGRLLRDLPDEQRRDLVRDETNREAMMDIREAMMDDMVRRFARGEDIEPPWARGRRNGQPRGERPGGPPGDREELSEEEREERRRERTEMMRERISSAFESGNSQSVALRGEFFKRMREMRQQNGGGSRGGNGGGGRGGR